MVQPENRLLNLFFRCPCTVALHEMQKALCRLCVGILQKLCHHIRLKHLHLALIRNAESRIKTNFIEVIADDKQAKGVNRRNLCIVYQ